MFASVEQEVAQPGASQFVISPIIIVVNKLKRITLDQHIARMGVILLPANL
jgi:hypothetical protein